MYFIVGYNWLNNRLTDRYTVGFFRSLKKAKSFCSKLNYPASCNTLAIVRVNQGMRYYNFPIEVYQWCEIYEGYATVLDSDPRRREIVSY